MVLRGTLGRTFLHAGVRRLRVSLRHAHARFVIQALVNSFKQTT